MLFERDSRRLVLSLTNGAALAVPISVVPALRPVPDAEIERVRLDPLGLGLHWERLDLDVSVSALIQAVLGPSLLHSAAGAQGGKATSRAKAAAARRNGRKGGRPRKQRSSGK